MKQIAIFLWLALFSNIYAETSDLLPVLYKGRVRPLSAEAQLWVEELLDTETIAAGLMDPKFLLIEYHFFGISKLKNLPLFAKPRHDVRQSLNLLNQPFYSYNELFASLKEQSVDSLLKEVIAYEYGHSKKLTPFGKQLKVGLKGDDLVILERSEMEPFSRFENETLILENAKEQLESIINSTKEKAEELLPIIEKMDLFNEGFESQQIEKEYLALAEKLIQKQLEPEKIAKRLQKEIPLKVRLQAIHDPINELPSKWNPAEWYSLKALELEQYNPKSNKLEPVPNFTLFSDADFEKIRKNYLELKKTIAKDSKAKSTHLSIEFSPHLRREINRFAAILLAAYKPISDKTFYNSDQSELYFPSVERLEAEHLYTHFPFVKLLFLLYGLAFFAFLLGIAIKGKTFYTLGFFLSLLAFSIHTALLIMRIYILSRPPVATMYETLLYAPWVSTLLSLILYLIWRVPQIPLVSNIVASSLLFLSLQMSSNPLLENIQPVLNSQLWLTVHVLMVVSSYGVFIFAGLLAHIWLAGYLLNKEKNEWMRLLIKPLLSSLYIGVILLISGTILGGIWANMSWGRFWDWDPKESWALISSLSYIALIHLYRFGKIGSFGLSLGSIIGLVTITFTWYGVNYLLGTGLHSYGFSSGGVVYYLLFLGLELLFIGLCATKRLTTKGKWEINPPNK